MRCTWSLVAAPYPTRACLTSLEVYWATSHPASAAATRASPLAWPTDMAVLTLTWKKTRSTATTSGASSATRARSSVCKMSSRSGRGAPGSVSITPAARAVRALSVSPRTTRP